MKVARAAFVNTVQCGGSTVSATYGAVVGDRPGQQGFEIDLVEVSGMPCIKLRKEAAGKVFQTHVPIFNVSHFEPMNEEQLAKLAEMADKKAKLAKEAKDEAERLKKSTEKKP